MTDPITQAREALAEAGIHPTGTKARGAMYRALRALIDHAEKLQAERDAAIKNRDEWASRMMEFATAQQDLAAAQAVIAQALDFPADDVKYDGGTLGSRMRRVLLQAVPLDALQAERARAWTEGWDTNERYGYLEGALETPLNPYITHTEGDAK